MSNDDNVIGFENTVKNAIDDGLTGLIRSVAKEAIHRAILQEVNEFVEQYKELTIDNGKRQVVKNGYHPRREVLTGVGPISVKMPRARDRAPDSDIAFRSNLIPPYMRRAKSLDELLPLLYLQGVSTNHFQQALSPLLGDQAKNISPSVISQLKAGWSEELQQWQRRSLADKQYVYWWVDGVYLSARMANEKTCMLVIIGVTPQGKKELVAFDDGFRECQDSWLALLRKIKSQGLKDSPKLAIGDGHLGFWAALEKEHPTTLPQRCWVHKTANVLAKLPKALQSQAKGKLKEIYTAPDKDQAQSAFDKFLTTYKTKYPKATECLNKNRESLLNFYHYPAEHWVHIRTTNPIESTFATIKHRTRQARGCYSRETLLSAFFKLAMQAQKNWRTLKGTPRLAEVIDNIKFIDGISEKEQDPLKQDKQNAA